VSHFRNDVVQHAAALAAASLLFLACSSKKVPEPVRNSPAQPEQVLAKAQPREQAAARVQQPAPAPRIDPARVPVEEDFRAEAARKLTKRSDVRAELDRIERSIGSSSQ
jgi:hypothetical protein